MRKVRDGLTLSEAWEWAQDIKAQHGGSIEVILCDLICKQDRSDYPDSFYEQPQIGSFGEFWRPNLHTIWGHLVDIDMVDKDLPYLCENGLGYQTFTPGLPPDVDSDGNPKQEA